MVDPLPHQEAPPPRCQCHSLDNKFPGGEIWDHNGHQLPQMNQHHHQRRENAKETMFW